MAFATTCKAGFSTLPAVKTKYQQRLNAVEKSRNYQTLERFEHRCWLCLCNNMGTYTTVPAHTSVFLSSLLSGWATCTALEKVHVESLFAHDLCFWALASECVYLHTQIVATSFKDRLIELWHFVIKGDFSRKKVITLCQWAELCPTGSGAFLRALTNHSLHQEEWHAT